MASMRMIAYFSGITPRTPKHACEIERENLFGPGESFRSASASVLHFLKVGCINDEAKIKEALTPQGMVW